MSFKGKIALVTGASRGIGSGILHGLAAAGATVIGSATSEEGANKITETLKQHHFSGGGIVMNVAIQHSIDAAIETIKSQYGMPTILVNNAAITQDNLLLRMKDNEWEDVMETNLNSIYRVVKSCLRDMIKARWGRIINVGSIVGTTGNAGQVNYATAKAGLIGFSKSLAQEIGSRNITVNVVSPGFIDTDMTRSLPDDIRQQLMDKIPAQRLGAPDDIAAAVVFLASEGAGYITGQTLHVNGGMYMA